MNSFELPAREASIRRESILPYEAYASLRKEVRDKIIVHKSVRRLAVGPHAMFHFESYQTMWVQIQEMLHIERGGDAQLAEELAAYNPLVPKGNELVATILFEIPSETTRKAVLGGLGGIENRVFMRIGSEGESITARPEEDTDRTNAAGKASSVQFVHFLLTPSQVEAFRRQHARVELGFSHPNYRHSAVLPEACRASIAEDL